MKYFTLRFIRTPGFVSNAIAFVEGVGAHADHAEGLNRAGTGWIGAHSSGGVQDRPLDYAKNIVWERQYKIPMTEEQYDKALSFLESKIGVPYDFSDILGILFKDVRLESPNRLICSVLQFEALWAAGIFMLNVAPEAAHLVNPDTLHMSPLLIGHASYTKL